MTLTAPKLSAWIDGAQQGETVAYWTGAQPPRAVLAAARDAYERGLVTLHTGRAPASGMLRYIALRTGAAVASAPVPASVPVRTSPEARILRVLKEAARRGRPCPTNVALARKAGLGGKVCASYRVRKLVAGGLIRVEHPGAGQHRIVTIVATGLSTSAGAL